MKYIYNDETDIALFEQIFGAAWETAAGLEPGLGAFVLLDDVQRAVLDENAARCIGLKQAQPDYTRLKELISFSSGKSADFEVRLLNAGENRTAGFLRCCAEAHPDQLHFRLCSQQAFAAAAVQEPQAAVMMLSVEGAEGNAEERDSCLFSAADAIFGALPEGACMTRISETEFRLLLPPAVTDPEAFAAELRDRVSACTIRTRIGTVLSAHRMLGLCAGICTGSTAAAFKMHAAAFALYEARSGKNGGICMFYPEKYEQRKEEYSSLIRFSRLLGENRFVYHFQPIVSAHTGEIVAYEALMRSDPSIGYGPLEILSLAEKRGRLYDIELATLRNALTALSENQSFFDDRKLFINSIPSQILTDADFSALLADFGELTEKAVIEMTEHTELNDEALAFIKQRLGSAGMQLALDDYGTGYSNTSNLMRYTPDYLKLDRTLIAGIDSDPKKQALVASIIEFVHANGCMALAEGVETLEEVRTVIRLSADLLQGYYVSRPKPVLISEISENIRSEIEQINLEAQSMIRKVYCAADGGKLELSRLAAEKYTDIFIEGGKVALHGEPDKAYRLTMSVREGAECEITLHNVQIEADQASPVLTLGKGAQVCLICDGDSSFRSSSGIYVPAESSLRFAGAGRLTVTAESSYCCGIGSSYEETFGEIVVDMDGTLRVFSNGEKIVGIGGGIGGSIRLTSGAVEVTGSGTEVLGIGSYEGGVPVSITDCAVLVSIQAVAAVGVGSMRGDTSVEMQNLAVTLKCAGAAICGAGVLHGGKAEIRCSNLAMNTEMNGRNIVCIGANGGTADCEIKNTELHLNCEGGSVTGVGNPSGGGKVYLRATSLTGAFRTGNWLYTGCSGSTARLEYVINDIKLNP